MPPVEIAAAHREKEDPIQVIGGIRVASQAVIIV
jgi:hypothetical protein